jgi:ABC-type transporter MlaC component
MELSYDEMRAAFENWGANKLSKSQKMKENKAIVKKAFKLMRNEKFMAKKSMTKKSWSKKSLNKKMRSKKIFRKSKKIFRKK